MLTKLSATAAILAAATVGAAAQHAGYQVPAQPVPAQAPAPEAVAACLQAQQQAGRIADRAHARLEAARQTNNPTDMRAAFDDLQAALGEIRAQARSCAELQTTPAAHAGHQMGKAGQTPPIPPGTPVTQPGSTSPAPAAAGAQVPQPAAEMDHSKMGHSKPPEKSTTPRPAGSALSRPSSDHAKMGHDAGAKPAAPSNQPKSHEHSGLGRSEPRLPVLPPKNEAVDPVCAMKVDPKTASKATYQGRTYYFCSEADKAKFLKDPAQYLKKMPR